MSFRRAGLIAFASLGAAFGGCSAADVSTTAQEQVRGASYTTFDTELQGCSPGSPNGVNCNHYVCQDRVYITGGPNRRNGGNTLDDGTYYFAVLTPGSQNGGAADGAEGNLSDNVAHGGLDLGTGDTIADRTFTMSHGVLSYTGLHPMGTSPNGQPIVRLANFDITSNPGGVYILAICRVGSSDPDDCKFDAFKTARCDEQPPPGCQDKCHEGDDKDCVECPPTCDPNCVQTDTWSESTPTCTPCPQQCDLWCDPSAAARCTPCL